MSRNPQLEGSIHAPEFPSDAIWLNTPTPLSIAALKGKIVLLDFWTYCCINCLHVLRELRALEEKYPEELVVIGVHSAKFTNERDTSAIQHAIARYDIQHPVINDHDFKIWEQYGIRAWPSFMLINPIGRIIGSQSGEGIYKVFDTVIQRTIRYFESQNAIERSPMPDPEIPDHTGKLKFPGKVHADETLGKLFISDSGHNRILVTDLDGGVADTIGSGKEGFRDGAFETCELRKPQGTARQENFLYICDTDNHAVRVADLEKRTLTTLFGNGAQARMPNVSGRSTDVRLNSPWDLVAVEDKLYVAMAGAHQIWKLDTRSLDATPFAGSSREDIDDGALLEATLAQPSGITFDGSLLYVADSEVSAIRAVDPDAERVTTLVGKGLFEFGHADGDPSVARLQHPLGIDYLEGTLYVADTYNHSIRTQDRETGQLSTLSGVASAGHQDGPAESASFSEPSGISVAGNTLYIADTNNHAIRLIDLTTKVVSTLPVH